MTTRYMQTMFTPDVKAVQDAQGSRAAYGARDHGAAAPDRLTAAEAGFIAARDSFYMATVGATGWPYLQHRGGPEGFVRVADAGLLAWADFRGNRQYISLGNIAADDRASLFFMDYPQRARLKLIGHLGAVAVAEAGDLAALVADTAEARRVERVMTFRIEAFDWNCPQHIVPRYTAGAIAPVIDALKARIAALEAELAARG